jgi:hypothetical protein
MKIFILLFIICIIAFAEEAQLPTDWRPIIGYESSNSRGYVDVNSFVKNISDDNIYVQGIILITINDPPEVVINDKNIIVKSLVKHISVECTNRYLIRITDFYFSVVKPGRDDKPFGGYKYLAAPEDSTVLNKSSVIYQTFCPAYI